ncbi:hypothetical protein BN871_AI_01370 [Paenibacillus sp. P22]|nr:hypothetical protein BN871_AI_01370 [Paenibacillus sp. P22]
MVLGPASTKKSPPAYFRQAPGDSNGSPFLFAANSFCSSASSWSASLLQG